MPQIIGPVLGAFISIAVLKTEMGFLREDIAELKTEVSESSQSNEEQAIELARRGEWMQAIEADVFENRSRISALEAVQR